MSNSWILVSGAFVLIAALVGCQAEVDPGPSYAELVVTYNAELEALDRLESKRDKLIQDYAASMPANAPVDTVTQLKGLLKSANELKDSATDDTSSDPEAQLDGLLERGGEAQEIANQLLDDLLSGEGVANQPEPTPEEAAAMAERKAAFDKDLAELDAEITKQEERVERARQARDKAEEEMNDEN